MRAPLCLQNEGSVVSAERGLCCVCRMSGEVSGPTGALRPQASWCALTEGNLQGEPVQADLHQHSKLSRSHHAEYEGV